MPIDLRHRTLTKVNISINLTLYDIPLTCEWTIPKYSLKCKQPIPYIKSVRILRFQEHSRLAMDPTSLVKDWVGGTLQFTNKIAPQISCIADDLFVWQRIVERVFNLWIIPPAEINIQEAISPWIQAIIHLISPTMEKRDEKVHKVKFIWAIDL